MSAWTGRLLIAAVGLLIILGELDRLSEEFLTRGGQSFSIQGTIGPLALGLDGVWTAWAAADPSPRWIILTHTAVDVVFIVCYLFLFRRILSTVIPAGLVSTYTPAQLQASVRTARAALWALVGIDAAEDLLLLVGAITMTPGADLDAFGKAVALVSTAKFVALLALVVAAARSPLVRERFRSLRTTVEAVVVHRFAALAVLVLAVLSMVPRAGVLEQLPDVQRSWIEKNGEEWGDVVPRIDLFGAALAATVIFFAVMLLINRYRTGWYADLPPVQKGAWPAPPPPPPPAGSERVSPGRFSYGIWFAIPVGILLVALVLLVTGHGSDILVPQFPIAVVASSAIPVVSLLLRRFRGPRADRWARRRSYPLDDATVRAVGDGIAASAWAVAGLGIVRSFTAPAVLGFPVVEEHPSDAVLAIGLLSLGATIAGLAFAVFAAPAFAAVAAWASPAGAPPPWAGRAAFGVVGGLLLALALFPSQLAHGLGVLPITSLILIALFVTLTVALTELQRSRPLELLAWLRFRTEPLITLLLFVPVIVAQILGGDAIHAIVANASPPTASARLTLDAAFEDWAEDGVDCVVSAPDGSLIRPLVLVAAEGGGIRAATWTIDVVREFLGDECRRDAIFLSSGASGGSVGLATLRDLDADAEWDDVSADRLGQADSVAVGVTGLMVGDAFAASTGLRLPSLASAGGWEWRDRAALIEAAWRAESAPLSTSFDLERQTPTGWLLLNSATATIGCKVVVSQLDLGIGSGTVDALPECGGGAPGVARTVDLLAHCDLATTWSTAAMLSARFPYVTPAGYPRDCGNLDNLQLIDGGYFDNSALSSVADLAPELTTAITAYNSRPETTAFVVPFVLYVRNSAGADVIAPDAKAAPQLVVPLNGILAADSLSSEGAWLQRLADTLDDVCGPADDDAESQASACANAITSSRVAVRDGVVVAAPSTYPAIAAPLGWTLSDLSQSRLYRDAKAQLEPLAEGARLPDYARLRDLFRLLGSHD
jgi:hypothetical protein